MNGRPYTFNDYHTGYSGEVKQLSKEELELNNYTSEYTQMYTILMETGWERKNSKWYSPHTKASFRKIKEAYNVQKMWEKLKT